MDTAASLSARRDAIIAEHGPWVAYNIDLGHGVFTREPGQVGTAEFMIHGLTQVISDLGRRPLRDLRVLDLGCHEGGYSIELARQGCTVVGIEGRRANIAKARFAAEALGLDNAEFVEDDVRNLSVDKYGRFDVVVCFGILYHLGARDAVRLIEHCYACSDHLTMVRTAVGLTPNTEEAIGQYRYRGRRYREDVSQAGASLDNPTSVLPSRASLYNLLADVGFTAVLEVHNPVIPGLDIMRDTVTVVAVKGDRVMHRSVEGVDQVTKGFRHIERRSPYWVWQGAHPQQGPFWKLREALTHTFVRGIFQSNRAVEEWLADQSSATPRR
jgi:SAM-dependent methyltransferase